MILKLVDLSGPMQECECCGSFAASGLNIYINGELIWRQYFDGHLGGEAPEEPILDAVVNAWSQLKDVDLEKEFTQEKRHEWNQRYPGNGVARTVESWQEYKNEKLAFQKQAVDNVKQSCSPLPYNEELQVKMIALWIQEHTGEKIQVMH